MKNILILSLVLVSFSSCLAKRSEGSSGMIDKRGHAWGSTHSSTKQVGEQATASTVIKVNAGERLYQIAKRHNVDLYELIRVNDIVEIDNPIVEGQELILPSSK